MIGILTTIMRCICELLMIFKSTVSQFFIINYLAKVGDYATFAPDLLHRCVMEPKHMIVEGR
jgi:hypothetical protein